MAVYGFSESKAKASLVSVQKDLNLEQHRATDIASTRFFMFWDLMDTTRIHGYVRAAMSVVGRSAIGAWWSLRKHEEFGGSATERQRRRLMRFYLNPSKQWTNIKDFQNLAYKLMIGAMYLRYFGQVAYQILRNEENAPIGIDHLPGYVVPNVDAQGNFKSPAWYQYPTRNPRDRVVFARPDDIIFITNPDFEGFAGGGSDVLALAEFALPLDIYLQTAAREYMKNRDKPEALYILGSDTSDDAFDAFVEVLGAKYAGAANVGKNPVVVKGDLDVKEFRPLPASLPYQQARDSTREEVLAVSGTPGAKLGLTQSLASANLRETRREFHETMMVPLFRLIETALWEQLHVREFGIIGWELRFNSPDFLNAVERATVHMRYKQMSALTSNEIRYDLGKPARSDENGDRFEDQMGMTSTPNPQGNPPEGRPVEPDDPSQTGEPTEDGNDPERGDQHDDTVRMLQELRQWRTFVLKRVGKGTSRPFHTSYIPDIIRDVIQADLDRMGLGSEEEVRNYFLDAEQILTAGLNEIEVTDGMA